MSWIPLNRFCPVVAELAFLRDAMASPHISGDGPFTQRCQRFLGGKDGDCAVAEQISERLLSLPFYKDLHQEDQERIVPTILGFCSAGGRP
jgi:hypothetical protein